MAKQSPKGIVVNEYLEKYPELPLLTLAKLIYKEHPALFRDVEAIRRMLRDYTGRCGNKRRKYKPFIQRPADEITVYSLPKSEADDWEPYILPKSITRLLVLSDIHLPYHDESAITAAVDFGKHKGVDGILLNGDIMDCYTLSKYEQDPDKRKFWEELETLRQFIGWLRQELDVPIYYKLGNHEERYQRWMRVKAPLLLGTPEYQIEHLIQARAAGIHVIKDKRIVMAGKLPILHGHEVQGSGSVNPARTLYFQTNESAMKGHSHVTIENSTKTLSGEMITTWSTGCLCGLHPEYARINKWNHGFAFVRIDTETGHYKVSNLRILNGEVL